MRRLVLAIVLVLAPCALRAQDLSCEAGDIEVAGVGFHGNTRFSDGELSNAIVTTPSSWGRRVLHIPIGAQHCLDTLEVLRDAVRLKLYYHQRGFYHTKVTSSISHPGPRWADVDFAIIEGPPVVIDTLQLAGLDSLPDQLAQRVTRGIDRLRGGIYNEIALQAAIDSVVERLQNNGYAHAVPPLRDISVVDSLNRARVKLTFIPGVRSHIGRVMFDLRPNEPGERVAIDSSTVRKMLSFGKGDLYRQRDLLRTTRDLYGLETYRRVDISIVPDSALAGGGGAETAATRRRATRRSRTGRPGEGRGWGEATRCSPCWSGRRNRR